MRKQNILRTGVLLLAMLLSMTACKDDDKTPEQLPDTLETTTEYYLVGIVSSSEGVVKNAEVKVSDAVKTTTDAEGKYNLTLDKTGEYNVSIKAAALEDFSTKVSIDSKAGNRSTVTLNITLSKAVEYTEPVAVKTDEETKVEVPAATETATEPAATVTVPAAAADEGVTISAGTYEEPSASVSTPPAATEEKQEEQVAISSIALKAEPADAKAKKPILIATPNPSTNTAIYFDPENMTAQKDATLTRAWEDFGKVKFNNGNYEITIPAGTTIAGKYATRVKADKVTGKEMVGEANLANGEETVKKDNSGNLAGIKDFEIKVAIKSGWEYTTTPAAALKAAGAEDAQLAAAIARQIEANEGTPKVYTVERTLKTNISGNSILYYQNKAQYCTKTYTFRIVVNGSKKSVKVVLKHYTGSKENYVNESSDKHSGGGTGI